VVKVWDLMFHKLTVCFLTFIFPVYFHLKQNLLGLRSFVSPIIISNETCHLPELLLIYLRKREIFSYYIRTCAAYS